MREIDAAKRHNQEEEKRLKAWEDTKKAVDDRLLEEYQVYATELYNEQQVRNTYASYLTAANGDTEIALNFLVKAFPAYDRSALEAIVQKTEE
jgi:hypothetical protein